MRSAEVERAVKGYVNGYAKGTLPTEESALGIAGLHVAIPQLNAQGEARVIVDNHFRFTDENKIATTRARQQLAVIAMLTCAITTIVLTVIQH